MYGHRKKKSEDYILSAVQGAITFSHCSRCGMAYEKEEPLYNPFHS
jgi:hypothetical protein